jgi:hypothetical protein
MGIMFQTFRPNRKFGENARYLLEKWNNLTSQKKETIIKEVLGENPRADQRREALAKAISNASTDQP